MYSIIDGVNKILPVALSMSGSDMDHLAQKGQILSGVCTRVGVMVSLELFQTRNFSMQMNKMPAITSHTSTSAFKDFSCLQKPFKV